MLIGPKKSFNDAYTEKLGNAFGDTIWTSACSSWHLDDDAIPASYPRSASHYRRELSQINLIEYDIT